MSLKIFQETLESKNLWPKCPTETLSGCSQKKTKWTASAIGLCYPLLVILRG